MSIKTAKDGYVTPGKLDTGARSVIDRVRSLDYPVPEPADGDPTGPPVVARINHGRWIGDCNGFDLRTSLKCLNAQFVHPDDHRFFCIVCFNNDNDGKWRPVTWPGNKDEIEQSLDGLPIPEQNWSRAVERQLSRFATATTANPEGATFDLRTATTSAMVVEDPTAITLTAPIDSEGIIHVTRGGQHVSSHTYLQDREVRRFPPEWFEVGDEVTIERLEV